MTNCPNCGKPNEDLQSHCIECGQSLTAEPVVNEPAPTTPEEQPQVTTGADTESFGQPQPFTPPVVPQPKKKSRLGLYLGGGILGIVAVVGIVFLVLAMMNPLRVIATAANKTGEALQQQIGTFQSLEAFAEAYDNYWTADLSSESVTIALGTGDAGAVCITGKGVTDYANHQLGIELSLGTEGGDSITVPIYLDDEGISITAPQLLKDTMFYLDSEFVHEYLSEIEGMPITELKDVFNQDVAESMSEEQVQAIAAVKNAFTQLLVNAKPEKQEVYTHKDAQWTPYLMVFRDEDTTALESSLVDLINVLENDPALGEYTEILLSGEDANALVDVLMEVLNQATVYINDQGYLVGYSFADSEECFNLIALEGAENPWSNFAFYCDEECVAQCSLTNENGLVSLTMGDGEQTFLLHLTYEDATGTFTITDEDEIANLSMRFGAENEQAIFRFSMAIEGIEFGMDFALGTSTETIGKPTADILYDVATMTDAEAEELLNEATMVLLTDPEVAGILNDILAVLQGVGILGSL